MIARAVLPFPGLLLSLLLAPLLPGIINRVKARMAGRQGRPVLQLYYDLWKLWQKKPVYSGTTSWVFKAGPVACLATALAALSLVPWGGLPAVLAFPGDFFLLGGLFALGRFAIILAALDTGSAFEGMGAAREALFSALAEPIFVIFLALLSFQSGEMSLSRMLGSTPPEAWSTNWPFFLLLAVAFFLLLLTENSRIPVDDPNTHLELTMIHEVMVLDHSGPDLALIEYASALKLWIFSLILANLLAPTWGGPFFTPEGSFAPGGAGAFFLRCLLLLCYTGLAVVVVGLVESCMARLRMARVPQLLTLAGSFACLAGLLIWR